MDRVLLQESTVEGDDLVDLKSERKRVVRGKRLKLKAKRVEDDLVDMKSERKHVERGKRQKSERKDDRVPDRGFDVIAASPRNSHCCGGVVACPITNATRPLLIELSKIALEEYNDENNQDTPFEFDKLVMSTRASCNGRLYCITFKAKRSSNTSSTIFQAIVGRRSFNGLTKVFSCAIKTIEG